MERPFYTPIEQVEEFTKHGKKRKRLGYCGNFYLFELISNGRVIGYEILKGKRCTQPDGTKVYCLPSDEDFGTYGWYLTGATINDSLSRLKESQEDFPFELFSSLIEGGQ